MSSTGTSLDQQSMQHQIRTWKEKRKAIILAHNYQSAEVQDVADLCGDSLELARKAAATDAETIVFCGVHFMAESAKILSPQKTVLLPVPEAGCPMADMVTAPSLAAFKQAHPDTAIVAYVNSSAEVKAESDYCCTSANAVTLVNAIPERKILFVPDKNLGHWVKRHTDKDVTLWDGFCATHDLITVADVVKARAAHGEAQLLVHPECKPEICDMADAVLSTSQMIAYAQKSAHQAFIIATEVGLLHALQKANPHKQFYAVNEDMYCPNMKLTDIHDVIKALVEFETQITVPEAVQKKAVAALEAMIRYG